MVDRNPIAGTPRTKLSRPLLIVNVVRQSIIERNVGAEQRAPFAASYAERQSPEDTFAAHQNIFPLDLISPVTMAIVVLVNARLPLSIQMDDGGVGRRILHRLSVEFDRHRIVEPVHVANPLRNNEHLMT